MPPAPPPTQFDPAGSMKGRPLERALLTHRLLHDVANVCAKAFFTALLWPRFVAPYRWKLTRYPMPFPGLPRAFEGYKVLHLSDLHMGRTRPAYVRRVVDRCLREKPDLVVITGDLIHYHPDSLARLAPVLRQLTGARPPDGVLAIFGNHDYHEYSWRHTGKRSAHRSIHKRLRALLAVHGVTTLINQRHVITRNGVGGGRLHVVGLDELWAGNHNPGLAFEGVPSDEPVLCLQHNPDGLDVLKDYPWRWMLCGHSHGGQIDLPLLGPLYVPQEHRDRLRGFFTVPDPRGGHKTMFVSTGVGHSAPLRLRVPPEATLFTLARENDEGRSNE